MLMVSATRSIQRGGKSRTSPPASAEEESKNMHPSITTQMQIHQDQLPIYM